MIFDWLLCQNASGCLVPRDMSHTPHPARPFHPAGLSIVPDNPISTHRSLYYKLTLYIAITSYTF